MSSAESLWVPALFAAVAALLAWAGMTWTGTDEEAHGAWVLTLLPNPAARFVLWTLAGLFAVFAIGAWRGGALESAAIAGAMSLGVVMMILAAALILFGALAILAAIAACLWLIYSTATRPAGELDRRSRFQRYLGSGVGLIWSIGWTAQFALQVASGDIDAVLETLRWDAMFAIGTNLAIAIAALIVAFEGATQERPQVQTKRRQRSR